MKRKIPPNLRKQIAERAKSKCEYCRVREEDSFLPFEVDHIVSIKHGGGNEISNLAFACPHCNQHKGTDLVTFLESYLDLVPLFNPRVHSWFDHFSDHSGEIHGKTRIGEGTIKLLRLNEPERIIQRQVLSEVGLWP